MCGEMWEPAWRKWKHGSTVIILNLKCSSSKFLVYHIWVHSGWTRSWWNRDAQAARHRVSPHTIALFHRFSIRTILTTECFTTIYWWLNYTTSIAKFYWWHAWFEIYASWLPENHWNARIKQQWTPCHKVSSVSPPSWCHTKITLLMKEFCDPTSAFDKSGAFSLLIEFPKVAHLSELKFCSWIVTVSQKTTNRFVIMVKILSVHGIYMHLIWKNKWEESVHSSYFNVKKMWFTPHNVVSTSLNFN